MPSANLRNTFNHARNHAISNPIVSFDEEADQLVGAGPYERNDERAAYRAGHYERGFTTTSGQVTLKTHRLKGELRDRRRRAPQGCSCENITVMVTIGVNEDGYRKVIGCAEGFTEHKDCWRIAQSI